MQQEGLLCGAVQTPAGRGAVGLHQPYHHLHHYSCLGSCLLLVVYRAVTMQETHLLCVRFQPSPKQTYQMQALQGNRAGSVFWASCWHVALCTHDRQCIHLSELSYVSFCRATKAAATGGSWWCLPYQEWDCMTPQQCTPAGAAHCPGHATSAAWGPVLGLRTLQMCCWPAPKLLPAKIGWEFSCILYLVLSAHIWHGA